MKKFITTLLLFISVGLIAGGCIILNGYATSQRVQAEALANAHGSIEIQPTAIAPETVQGTPVKIEVSEVAVSNSIEPGYYNPKDGSWTLSDTSAFYATITAPANSQTGNTFIYGHNADNIFGNLRNAKEGMKAIVTTDNGYQFTYILQSFKAVSPNDVSLIQPTEKPTLTLQTCSGTWYQFRTLYTFSLDHFDKL